MIKSWQNFLGWELTSRDTIDLKKIYIDICGGDIIAGLLLSQIIYWFLPNKLGKLKTDLYVDGVYWITKRRSDWYDEIRISPKQFDRALDKLVKLGILKTMLKKFGVKPQIWISIEQDNLIKAINKTTKEMLKFNPKKKVSEPKETDHNALKVNEILNGKSEEFAIVFNEFVEMRKAKKRVLTPYAKLLRLNEIDKLYPENEEKQIESINMTITGGWDKFYLLKEDKVGNRRNSEGF